MVGEKRRKYNRLLLESQL